MTTFSLPGFASTLPRLRSPLIVLCVFLLGAVSMMAAFGSLLTLTDPARQNLQATLAGPSWSHPLGTDALGRDVFSRLIVGARSALVGPLVITVGSMLIGNVLGLVAGYRGGKIESFVMRWVDLMYALPGLLVIIVVAGAFGGGYWLAVGLLIVLTAPFDTRVVRAATLEQAPLPYVEAARTVGVPDRKIMLLHIWPNISATAVANSFLILAAWLVGLAGLSFLGLGVRPGTADWGLMVAEGRSLLFANPIAALAPAAMIVATATSANLVGDWAHERLSRRGTGG